jgi:hypothetical protein
MPAPPALAGVIDRLRKRHPASLRLAEEVSLAVRVEPALLREARLRLSPPADASAEADLWFSPLVQTRTADWLVLEPAVAADLRRALARDAVRLRAARDLVVAFHRHAPRPVLLEEDILWRDVSPEGEAAQWADERLHDLLRQMRADPEAGRALARWFAGTARRVPPWVKATEAYSLLAVASSGLLGGRPVGEPVWYRPEFLDRLAEVFPDAVPRQVVWAALTADGLVLRPEEAAGFVPLRVPRTEPLLLEVGPSDGPRHVIALRRGERWPGWAGGGAVEIRTAAGDVYRLRPRRPVEAALSAAPPVGDPAGQRLRMQVQRNFLSQTVLPPWGRAAEGLSPGWMQAVHLLPRRSAYVPAALD